MNIWDSVHRGLEKASQEAARIAKAQRLRSAVDHFSQQLNTQEGLVIAKVMDLYVAGKLPPGDLFAACQELHTLHQRLNQLQSELNQLQSQQNVASSGNVGMPGSQGTQGNQRGQGTKQNAIDSQATQLITPEGQPASSYAPPPPSYPPFDSAIPPLVPPPPPGMETSIGQAGQSADAIGPMSPPPLVERNHCPNCHVALIPGNAFCHNCGTPVAFAADAQQATVRSGTDSNAETAATAGNASRPAGQNEPPEVIDEY